MMAVRPTASSFSNGGSARMAMRRPAPTMSRNADEDRGGAEQAELLADGGEDEVGLDGGDALRAARGRCRCRSGRRRRRRTAPARSGSRRRRRSDQGSSQMSTRSCTWPKTARRGRRRRRTDGADAEVDAAGGGDPQHHDEEGEEQQRRAEVLLADITTSENAPGQQRRARGAWGRAAYAGRPAGSPWPAARASRPGRRRRRWRGRSWPARRAGSRSARAAPRCGRR